MLFQISRNVNRLSPVTHLLSQAPSDSGIHLNHSPLCNAEFFNKRLSQGMDDVQIKSFEVPRAYLEDLRLNAVPERLARLNPDSPIRVDVTKAPDQYGLRRDQIEQLRRVIIQGSGKQEP